MGGHFTERDLLTGHLAALLPGTSQQTLQAAADGLIALGYWQVNPIAALPSVPDAAVEAGANQLRSQLGDFTSPDILMRKRARFVLRAALPHFKPQPVSEEQS
jgi:hypothetical protein